MTLKTSRTEGIANIRFKVAPCDRFHYMSHKHRAVAEEWNVQRQLAKHRFNKLHNNNSVKQIACVGEM